VAAKGKGVRPNPPGGGGGERGAIKGILPLYIEEKKKKGFSFSRGGKKGRGTMRGRMGRLLGQFDRRKKKKEKRLLQSHKRGGRKNEEESA